MISIIIPVYKAENYLRQCLDSILQQTYTDWEALLIDDGSPDNSGSICDEYAEKDARIKVFHIPNGGVSNARNVGLDHAQGEYFMFVDSDDWITNDALEVCLDAMEAEDLDYLQHGHFKQESNGQFIEYTAIPCEVTDGETYLQKKLLVPTGALSFYRRAIIEDHKIRYTEGLKIAEDLLFQLQLIRFCKRCHHIPNSIYYYRYNPDSAIHKRFEADDRLLFASKIIELSKEWPAFENQKNDYLKNMVIEFILNKHIPNSSIKQLMAQTPLPWSSSYLIKAAKINIHLAKFLGTVRNFIKQ